MNALPAILLDRMEVPPAPMPVIVLEFVTRKYGTRAIVMTPGGTFRTCDLDELTWREIGSDMPATVEFHEAVLRTRYGAPR